MKAQGATEYLVLLAVVLIVALVSVALLGFFPGMASDAQITQSQTYWQSAGPIAITEWATKAYSGNAVSYTYLRVRNTGAYPIRITKVLGNGQAVSNVYVSGSTDMSPYFYLGPGEESYFGYAPAYPALPANRQVDIFLASGGTTGYQLYAASSACSASPPYGTLQVKDFGFEYIEYIDGQQITKREIGKPLIIKCAMPW